MKVYFLRNKLRAVNYLSISYEYNLIMEMTIINKSRYGMLMWKFHMEQKIMLAEVDLIFSNKRALSLSEGHERQLHPMLIMQLSFFSLDQQFSHRQQTLLSK